MLLATFADAEIGNLLAGKFYDDVDEFGVKIWHCVDCRYSKRLKSDVVKHVERRHLNIKFLCNVCSLSFNSRTDLKTHMRCHS